MRTVQAGEVQKTLRRLGAPGWADLTRRHGRTYRVGGVVVTGDPAVSRAALLERPNTEERSGSYRIIDRFLPGGEGILWKEGEQWQRRLRAVMPSFTPQRIESLGVELTEIAEHEIGQWPVGDRLPNLADSISSLGLRSVLQTSYNLDPDDPLAAQFGAALASYKRTLLRQDERYRFDVLGLDASKLRHLPYLVRELIQLRRGMADVEKLVEKIAEDPPLHDPERKGWIQLLADEGFSGRPLATELNHLYSAYDAVDFIVCCALVELSRHPLWADRLAPELDTIHAAGRIPAAADSDFLALRAFVLETLRRYPGSMLVSRKIGTPVTAGDDILPPGTELTLSLYALHHDPEVWREPDRFDPGRWLKRNFEAPAGSFVPFLEGPRKCIGRRLAETQITAALVALRNYRLRISLDDTRVDHFAVPRWDRPIPFVLEHR